MTMPQPDPERMAQWTLQLCQVDSTTGHEARMIPLLTELFRYLGARVRWQTVEGGRCNLLATWGDPKLLFTTHLDTVPPYLSPRREGDRLRGRGTCDAKGILATMLETIRLLLAEGRRDLGFLGVVGEETDSLGARLFARTVAGSSFVQDVQRLRPEVGEVEVLFQRGPEVFPRLEGFPMAPVPFGSDAHTLRNLVRDRFVVMTGPGSIRVAHTEGEFLDLAEAVAGAHQYLALARHILDRAPAPDYAI